MEIVPDPLHALLLVLPFAVTAFFVNQVLWKPLLAFLDEREAVSRDALAAAEHAAHEAESGASRIEARLASTRAAVATSRAEARARAHTRETEIVAEARRQADARVGAAVREVQQARAAASGALEASARELSADIATNILARPVASELR
jgi:F-type H+-transporting ATPase subunit b